MIYLTQWLCPERHCSLAVAWDSSDTNLLQVLKKGEALYQKGVVHRWCGICGSHALKPEHGKTRFSTLREALPKLQQLEKANAWARAILGNRF